MTDPTPRVAVVVDEHGNFRIYADGPVEVLCVYEPTPGDRIYRYQTERIPDGLLDGPVGFQGDGSPAEARVTRAVREAFGMSPFKVVDGGQDG